MTSFAGKTLYWVPRGLCIAFGLFLSLFALDVFQEGLSFWRVVADLLMHLVPVFIFFAVLAVAWRWEWVGTVCFTALAGLHLYVISGRHLDWRAKVLIEGPLLILAGLFWVNWQKRAELRGQRGG